RHDHLHHTGRVRAAHGVTEGEVMVRRSTRRSKATLSTLIVLGLIATLAACQPPTPPKPAHGSALIPCSQADERVVITVSSHLDPRCTYTKGIEITASGATLARLNGVVRAPDGVTGVGILVHTPTDVALSDVTIKRCR